MLSSIRLTIILFVLLLGMSVWGTLTPGLSVYYSPVYIATLMMLAINLAACAVKRLKRIRGKYRKRDWGYLLTHLGILVIFAGSLTTMLAGFRTMLWLSPNETAQTIQDQRGNTIELGFEIELKKFAIELHPGGMLDEFVSEVVVRKENKSPETLTITVNHPLSINGFKIFQSSYQPSQKPGVDLSVKLPGQTKAEIMALSIDKKPMSLKTPECEPLLLAVLRYEPDFVMTGPGEFGSRSMNPNNPAVLVQLQCGNNEPEYQWLFLRHKNAHATDFEAGLTIILDGVEQYDTGLEIVKDPGAPLVALGGLLLIAGLFLYISSGKRMGDRQ